MAFLIAGVLLTPAGFGVPNGSSGVGSLNGGFGPVAERTTVANERAPGECAGPWGLQSCVVPSVGSASTLAAQANASPTQGDAPLLVTFTGSATGGTPPYNFSWTFGDGILGIGPNAQHFYGPGTYHARLWVNDSVGGSATANVSVAVNPSIVANFTMMSASGCGFPLTIEFHPEVSGGSPPYAYRWSFGDGNTSTLSDPTHTYTTSPTAPVTLNVTDSFGSSAIGQQEALPIPPCSTVWTWSGALPWIAGGLIAAAAVVTGWLVLRRTRTRPPPPSGGP